MRSVGSQLSGPQHRPLLAPEGRGCSSPPLFHFFRKWQEIWQLARRWAELLMELGSAGVLAGLRRAAQILVTLRMLSQGLGTELRAQGCAPASYCSAERLFLWWRCPPHIPSGDLGATPSFFSIWAGSSV